MSPEDQRAYNRRYYAANKAKLDARSKAWREANPDKRRATKARYYQSNAQAVNAAAKAWRKANPERAVAANRAWAKANRDKRNASWHRWRAAGTLNAQDVRDLVSMGDGICAYCLKPGETLDHVHPVKRGGLSTLDNFVLACGRCNSSKGSRTPLEFAFDLPRLGTR